MSKVVPGYIVFSKIDIMSEDMKVPCLAESSYSWIYGTIAHRVYLCIFSICMLWMTTLEVAIGIVGQFFSSPRFSDVHSSCELAYEEVTSQRLKYELCVDRGMAVCNEDLWMAHAAEKKRSDELIDKNANYLNSVRLNNTNCRNELDMSILVLKEWSIAGGANTVPYLQRCSDDNLAWVQTELNDASEIKSSGMSELRTYVAGADETLLRVTEYSLKLDHYNHMFVKNRTEGIRQATDRVRSESAAAAASALTTVNDQINALLRSSEQLVACIGLSDTSLTLRKKCVSGKGLYDMYLDLISMMEIQKIVVEDQILSFNELLEEYANNVDTAISAANNFYDSVNGARGLLNYLVTDLSLFRSSQELCGKSTPNWCSFSKRDWFVYPAFPPDAIIIYDLPGSEMLWDQLKGDAQVFQQAIIDTKDVFINEQSIFWGTVDSAVTTNMIPETVRLKSDYDPPAYHGLKGLDQSFEKEVTTQSLRGEHVTKSILETINGVSRLSLSSAVPRNFSYASFNSEGLFSGSSLTVTSPKLTFAPFSPPKIKTFEIFGHLNTILGVLYLIDYVYRLWLSVRVVRRHWSNSLVELPPCDIRLSIDEVDPSLIKQMKQDLDDNKVDVFAVEEGRGHGNVVEDEDRSPAKFSTSRVANFSRFRKMLCMSKSNKKLRGPITLSQSAVKLCTSFPAHLALLILFLFFMCYSLIALYLPWYDSYISNCVEGSDHRGTFIGRNVKAMGFNYAAAAGNDQLVQKVARYNELASSLCTESFTSSKTEFTNQSEFLDSIYRNHMSLLTDHEAILQCVDTDEVDARLEAACCSRNHESKCVDTTDKCPLNSIDNLPYPAVGNFIPSGSCSTLLKSSIDKNAVYECSSLPVCATACDGPHADVISIVSEQCTCMIEWFIHSTVLYCSLALFVYSSLNLTRIFFHKALVAIFWRELRGNHPFELLASCSIDGNVLIDTEVAVAETTPSGSVKGIDDSESPATGGAVEMMQWQYRNPSIKTKNEKTVSNSDCGGISCKPKDLQAVLSVSLANTIWRYDASMYWYFLLSICVNISWILSLFFFRDKLTYQGHTGRE